MRTFTGCFTDLTPILSCMLLSVIPVKYDSQCDFDPLAHRHVFSPDLQGAFKPIKNCPVVIEVLQCFHFNLCGWDHQLYMVAYPSFDSCVVELKILNFVVCLFVKLYHQIYILLWRKAQSKNWLNTFVCLFGGGNRSWVIYCYLLFIVYLCDHIVFSFLFFDIMNRDTPFYCLD